MRAFEPQPNVEEVMFRFLSDALKLLQESVKGTYSLIYHDHVCVSSFEYKENEGFTVRSRGASQHVGSLRNFHLYLAALFKSAAAGPRASRELRSYFTIKGVGQLPQQVQHMIGSSIHSHRSVIVRLTTCDMNHVHLEAEDVQKDGSEHRTRQFSCSVYNASSSNCFCLMRDLKIDWCLLPTDSTDFSWHVSIAVSQPGQAVQDKHNDSGRFDARSVEIVKSYKLMSSLRPLLDAVLDDSNILPM